MAPKTPLCPTMPRGYLDEPDEPDCYDFFMNVPELPDDVSLDEQDEHNNER